MIDLADEREPSQEQACTEKVQRFGEVRVRPSGRLNPQAGAVRAAEQEQEADDLDPSADLLPVRGNEQNNAQNRDGRTEPPEHSAQAQPAPPSLPPASQRGYLLHAARAHQPLR